MIINKKIVYARKKEEFEPLIPTIPEGLNPVVFIEDTREMWTCGTYFSIGYPSIEVSEVSGSVKVQIGNSFFLLTPTGDSISLRKGDGNRIIISSNALNRVDTEPPLKWDASNRKLLHMESGVASGSYGQSTNLGNASVFVVPNFIVDATGHITFAENHNIEIRDYVEQVAPSNQMAERNILLSYNEANNNMDTSQVRKANGLTFNDATQRITVAGGMVSDGAVTVNHGDVSVLDGYIIGKLKGDVEGQATPKIHLSLKPEYGGASTKLYGHVKLQDILSRKPDPSSDNENINDTNVVAAIAASPLMVWNAIETAKSYADSILGSNNAMLFKGALEAGISSPGTYTPMADVGNTYVVTFGNGAYRDSVGYINGVSVEVGDLLICKEATAASDGTNWEEVSKKWTYVQTNTTGVVSGPSSATIGQLAVFDSITGKLIKGLPNGSVGQMLVIGESGIPAWANKPDRLNYALSFQVKGVEFTSFDGYEAKKVNFIAGDNMFITSDNQGNLTLAADPGNDTVNTAGATDLINTKLFLIGAESQTKSPQTYSNRYVYVGADNCLYSDGKKVSTTDHTHPIYVTLDTEQTINGSKTFTTPIISTVASGTAPLVVASNTLVSNLNADLLDGLHAKSFIFYKEEDFDPATYDGYYMGMTTKSGINGDWWHIISMNWGGSNMGIVGNKTWVTQLALPTKGIRGLKYRTGNDSTSYGSWVDILDVTNYAGTLDGRYLKKTGDTMTGTLTSASTSSSIVFKGLENCDITNIYKDNGVIRNDDGGLTSIRNGLRFNWYDTYWYIGNLRGSSTDSAGFGVVDHNNKLVLRVTPNDVRAPRFMSTVATGLSPLIVSSNTLVNNLNADLLDGVHLAGFSGREGVMRSWLRGRYTTVNQYFGNGNVVTIDPKPTDDVTLSANTTVLSLGDVPTRNTQLAFHYDTNTIKYRRHDDSKWNDWVVLIHSGNYASYSDGRYVKKAGDTMTGDLNISGGHILYMLQTSPTSTQQIRLQGGSNDYGRIAFGATGSNAGWMEIASSGDGNEPIYARQYTGVFTTVKRTATLLDANGNTVFPGTVTAPTFTGALNGALNGTAEWSKRLATNSQLTFGLNGLTYFNANLGAGTAANQNVGPTAQWWHILRMNHGNSSGYFADIAVPLNTSDGIYWRRIQGGTNYGWYRVLDTNNYAGIIDGRYVNVTGDTMTGALSVATHLEVRAANTTTNAMLILHNPNRSWGNITFRDNMFYFVDGNSSTGTTYRPIKANYYIASATTLCTNLNADLLDGNHEHVFLRHRDTYGIDGYDTLWAQIGIRQYNNAKPDGMANPIYNYGAVISLPGANTRLDIWYNRTSSASDSSTNGIQYRSGWGTDKKPWRMLLDSVNAKHYNVGSATKLQTARQINGTNFDGTANIVTSYWGTARNFTIGNTTRSVNGSGNVSWSFADIGGAPASHSHNYINSRGNLNPQTGRTQNLGNVYSYNTVSGTSNGAPTTYTSVIGFGRSTGGTVEIAGGWTAGMGLWYRALRDTTDNWYGWIKVWDTRNFDPNSKANSNHNHDGSYITKGGSNNNVVLGAGGYRALSDFTLNSNWAASKDVSGYVKFPNGFIIQWGEAYVGANSTGYKSFPIAFPTACISVQVTHKTTATNWDKVCVAGNYTRTSCTIANGETVNSMINWMALGY